MNLSFNLSPLTIICFFYLLIRKISCCERLDLTVQLQCFAVYKKAF